jgi:F-type H+-transporting ATPase subunit gamma
MASGKEIKARIKSIKNTGKITKAMELISTVKMKKAQESVVSLRPFALAALGVLSRISHADDVLGIYGKAPEATRELIILVAAQK